MPSVRFTKTGLVFAALNVVVFFLAFVARARPLLVLGGFLAIVLLVVLLLALFNVFPLEVERRRRRLRGRGPFFLPLTVSRPWGTSYALKVRCAGGEGDLPLVKGRQQVILPLTDPPSGEQEVLLVSSFPLGFFRVAKRLRGPVISLEPSRHREKTHDSVSELTEYDGRHPWSRLDWKALARFQRLLVRKTGEEEEEEALPPPQKAFSVRKLHLPSPWPAVWAYVSAFLAAFPFLAEAPWWLTTGFLVGLVYGIWRVFSGQRAPLSENLGALAVFVIAVLSLPGLSWENLWGRLAGFVLAVILVKTLSPHREHDVLQILLLSFLLVLLRLIQGNCSVIWLLLVLLGGFLPGMYFWQLSSAGRGLRALGPLAVLLVSGGVSLLVFHYLPWSVPSSWSVTGLSPFFDLGDFAPLKRDHTLLGRLYPPETSGNTFRRVYLSAFVYTKYRRGHWSLAVLPLECKGRKEDFRLVLEEPLPALPYPGCPVEIRTPHGHWYPKRLPLAPAGPGEYRLLSCASPVSAEPSLFLDVPEEWKEDLEDLSRTLQGKTLAETLQKMRLFFQRHFTYSLSPGRGRGDPLRYFLFESRRGFCEHFASAATLLLRSLGIPARLVTGLVSDERDGDHFLLRASGAHAWVEVWDGRKWLLFDPTPLSPPRLLLLRGLLVLEDLLKPLFLAFLLVLVMLWLQSLRNRKDPVNEFLKIFEDLGEKREPHETLGEYVARLMKRHPHLSKELLEFVNTYHEVVFGEKGSKDRLRVPLKEIKARIQRQAKGSG